MPRTARSIGPLYLMMGLPGPFILMWIPKHFFVPGNAAATAAAILAEEGTYRLAMIGALISSTGFILIVQALYTLFRDVDRQQARLLVMFVTLAATIGFLDIIMLGSPLIVLKNADVLAAFTKPQLDALTYALTRLRSLEINAAAALWGIWLFPFGILALKSGFMPKFIGVLLIIGGFAYLIGSITALQFPAYFPAVSRWTLMLGGPGEVSAILWFFIRGGRVPMPRASTLGSSERRS